jgi:hypothetical protein
MPEMNRRDFLRGSSMAVATAGLVAAFPVLPTVVNAFDTEAPAIDSSAAATASEAASMSEPIVARVTDLSTGEIQMFWGTQEITYNDPQVAARLFQATQK